MSTKKVKTEKPMWLRVQEDEFEQSQGNIADLDIQVKNVSQTRKALIQAQNELKHDRGQTNCTKSKVKTLKTRENFAKVN